MFHIHLFSKVYVGALSQHYEALSVEASKQTTAEEIVSCIVDRLGLTVRAFFACLAFHYMFSVICSFLTLNFPCRATTMSWQKLQASPKSVGWRLRTSRCH